MSTTSKEAKMVQIPTKNWSHARHELDMKLLNLREDFHDASKKRYENARLDVEYLEQRMNAEAAALEEEFDRNFSAGHEAEAHIAGHLLSTRLEGAHKANDGEAKLKTTASGKAAHELGYESERDKSNFCSDTETNTAGMSVEDHSGEVDTPADAKVTTQVGKEGSMNDSEASTEIFATLTTPTSEAQGNLTAKRRYEHTGSSSSLSSPPQDLDSQSSTPSRVRNRKQRKSSAGVALKIGDRTSRSSKPENNGRAGLDETIGFSWAVSMIGWDPAEGTSELPVTWRRDISLKMKHPDFGSFKPYIGVENRGKLFPKIVLDDEWDGIAFYDKPSRRFEVFKKNKERLRIQFEDTKYWVFGENQKIGAQEVPSFMTAFKAELGSKIIVEQSSHLGAATDFMVEGAGSHPDHLTRMQGL